MSLDSGTSRPLYLQLRDKLLSMIREGVYKPRKRLPSERELAKRFNVSRLTVRQALAELVQKGIVYTQFGKGTYVSDPQSWRLGILLGFNESMVSQAKEPSSEIRECKLIPANEIHAARLQVSPADELVFLSRLRKVDGVPIVVEVAFIPHELCPGLLGYIDAAASLYSLFEVVYDIQVKSAEVSLSVDLANDLERDLLSLPEPSAVLHIEQLSLLEDGRPIELTYATYHGDVSSYQATVLRSKLGLIKQEERYVSEPYHGGMKIKEFLNV